MLLRLASIFFLLGFTLWLTGCELLTGIDERRLVAASGGHTSTGGSGGSSTSSGGGTGGNGGDGGDGGGGANPCPAGSDPGCLLWASQLKSYNNDGPREIAVDSNDDVLIAGMFNGGGLTCAGEEPLPIDQSPDIFVGKLDSHGNQLWCRSFPSDQPQDSYGGIAIDSANNVVIVGDFQGTQDFGGDCGEKTAVGGYDAFAVKLDASGVCQWAKAWGSADSQMARSVAIDGGNNIIITGFFRNTINFGVGGHSAQSTTADIFVAKLSPDGSGLWSRSFGGSQDDYAEAVALDNAGNIFVTGTVQGEDVDLGNGIVQVESTTYELFIAKYDPAGQHQWGKIWTGEGSQTAKAIAVNQVDGMVYVAGHITGTFDLGVGAPMVPNGYSAYVAKLDESGNMMDSWFEACSHKSPAIAVDKSGDVLVSIYLTNSCELGPDDHYPSKGQLDSALIKLDSSLSLDWGRYIGGTGDDNLHAVTTDSEDHVLATGSFGSTVDFAGTELVSQGLDDGFVLKLTP